jgi:hypothetical protein
MFILCERRDGSPIVIAGPCWPFCCLVTVPLILGICGAVAYFVIINEDSPLVGTLKWMQISCCSLAACLLMAITNMTVIDAVLGALFSHFGLPIFTFRWWVLSLHPYFV